MYNYVSKERLSINEQNFIFLCFFMCHIRNRNKLIFHKQLHSDVLIPVLLLNLSVRTLQRYHFRRNPELSGGNIS